MEGESTTKVEVGTGYWVCDCGKGFALGVQGAPLCACGKPMKAVSASIYRARIQRA